MERFPENYGRDENLPKIWLSRNSELPDVCSTCGMFTDRRARVAVVHWVSGKVSSESLSMAVALLVMDLIVGPLGWLVRGTLEDDTASKPSKQKVRLKISRCQLCEASGPMVSDGSRGDQFGFRVHPRFAKAFREANRAIELPEIKL